MSKVYGVISIKGGVGKTTTVANIGAALAKNFDKKVLLVDGNFSAPNLGLHLGVVHPKKHVHGVIHHKHSLDEAVHKHELGFDILPSSLTSNRNIEPKHFKSLIKYAKNHYDVVLIDSSPALNHEMIATMVASDELLVVATPDFPTLSTTMRAIKIAKQKKTPITGLILNKVRNKKFELSEDDIEDATNTPILAVLPDDTKVLESLSKSLPLTEYSPRRRAATNYTKLAAGLIGEEYRKESLMSRLKSFFTKDVDEDEVKQLLLKEDKL